MVLAGLIGGCVLAALLGGGPLRFASATIAFAAAWVVLVTICGICSDTEARPWSSSLERARMIVFAGLVLSWPSAGLLALIDGRHAVLAGLAGAAAAAAASIAGAGTVEAAVYRSRQRVRTLIIGSGTVAAHLVERLEHSPHLRLEPVGLLDDDVDDARSPRLPRLGTLDELERVIAEHRVDHVIFAFTRSGHDELLRCIRVCWDNHVAIDIVPRLFEFLDGARAVERVGGLPILSITAPLLTASERALKRATDVLLSATILLLSSPLLLLVALLIKLDSSGPVLFRQERVGRRGRAFWICKYRSMYLDADARKQQYAQLNDVGDGVMFKIHDDPRITGVGRYLRRFSIDELPQLFNVLRGEMSLVGPRPLIAAEASALSQTWQGRRLDLRPGMTGLWQIYGRSTIPFQDMLRFDYQYVANWSLARDVEIMLMTVPAMLSARGAY
jgi:exopolysaccharide biosynthesis polyprenyl glycosylphosphotransferase